MIDFEVEERKFDILLFPRGWRTAETSFNIKLNTTISIKGEIIVEIIKPAKDVNGKYKLGIFIRDEISGVGTITFIKGNKFASLGHPVIKEDGKTLVITGGTLYNCNITGAVKGERGKAG